MGLKLAYFGINTNKFDLCKKIYLEEMHFFLFIISVYNFIYDDIFKVYVVQ